MSYSSGSDYVFSLDLDTTRVETGAKRVEAILRRVSRAERIYNNERIAAANRLFTLERRIADQRLRGQGGRPPGPPGSPPAPPNGNPPPGPPGGGNPGNGRGGGRGGHGGAGNGSNRQQDYLSDDIGAARDRLRSNSRRLGTDFVRTTQGQLRDLERQVRQTTDPRRLRQLRRELSQVNRRMNQSIRNADRLTNRLNLQQLAARGLSASVMNLARSYLSIFAVIEGFRHFVNVSKKLEATNVALINASGSAKQAGEDFKYIRGMANKLGLEVLSTAKAFGNFGAAARLGGVSSDETREIFENIAKAVTSASLSTERAGLVFQAFQQVMSKGVLSMEEVRQQIGESLPQGMAALSRATGKTGTDLFKFIESGNAISKDILPLWAKELAKMSESSGALYTASNTIQAAWNRLLNTITDVVKMFSAGEGEVNALAMGIDLVTEAVKITANAITFVIERFKLAASIINDILSLIYSITGAFSDADDNVGKLTHSLTPLQRIFKTIGALLKVAIGDIKLVLALSAEYFKNIREGGIWSAGSKTMDTFRKQDALARQVVDQQREERLKYLKQQQASNKTTTMNATINVNGAHDARMVADEVNRGVQRLLTRMDE